MIYPTDGSEPYWPQLDEDNNLCHSDEQCLENFELTDENIVCGSIWERAGLDPIVYDQVRSNKTLLYGIPGFDNFFQALYTVF